MVTANPFARYSAVATQTADPLELVVMLYRGAIRAIAAADLAMSEGDISAAHRNLLRAQEIVAELSGTLNFEAGEVAENLARLYDFVHRQLVEANTYKSRAALTPASAVLTELLDSWEALRALAGSQDGRRMAIAG